MRSGVAVLGVLVVVLAACSSAAPPDGVELADGWTAEVVRDDLEVPTQLAVGPDGSLLVAELAGGEDTAQGRVRDLGPEGTRADPDVLLDQLLTPTGLVALPTGELLVQEQRELVLHELAAPTDGPSGVPREVIARTVLDAGRPFNGRSQGTLTLLPVAGATRVLATATGQGSGPEVPVGSGELYAVTRLDGAEDWTAETWATGFKNAYAHAPLLSRRAVYVTEIGDGRYDGERPLDRLVEVPFVDPGRGRFDAGWPRCLGSDVPVIEHGGTERECAGRLPTVASLPAQSTPTSVAISRGGRVLVALWVENRVVEVDPDTGAVTDVATGLDRPQHLLAMDDGTVLLTVHASGELVRLTPPD